MPEGSVTDHSVPYTLANLATAIDSVFPAVAAAITLPQGHVVHERLRRDPMPKGAV